MKAQLPRRPLAVSIRLARARATVERQIAKARIAECQRQFNAMKAAHR